MSAKQNKDITAACQLYSINIRPQWRDRGIDFSRHCSKSLLETLVSDLTGHCMPHFSINADLARFTYAAITLLYYNVERALVFVLQFSACKMGRIAASSQSLSVSPTSRDLILPSIGMALHKKLQKWLEHGKVVNHFRQVCNATLVNHNIKDTSLDFSLIDPLH